MENVYLDHNSTSPLRPEVLRLYRELLGEPAGNPSSLHASGRRARHLVDDARARVAAALGAHEDELVFTSGGTESNALALRGVLDPLGSSAGLVTTAVEHSSVLAQAAALEERGHPLALVGVDGQGTPDGATLGAALRLPATRLVSVMAANNEVGSVVDLRALAEALPRGPGRPLLHTDAVQALGRIPVRLSEWGVDLASFSAHKQGGPLGVGLLFRRRGTPVVPWLRGGAQELGLRAGTENAPAIAAAALAIELAVAELESFAERARQLVALVWHGIRAVVPDARLLGPALESPARLPNTLNVLLPGSDGKVLVTQLDLAGLSVSAGSACASGSLEPSHVLLAMGLDRSAARAGLRISVGWSTTEDDCRRCVDTLQKNLPRRTQHAASPGACAQSL